jgi:broad specificity phosphatase PhoE
MGAGGRFRRRPFDGGGQRLTRHVAKMNVFAIRHGETAWSLSGQHTGTTDIPLTENGRRLAERLRPVLAEERFALVLCSPMQRARETCELAGLGASAVIDVDLSEWNYGEYEGLTSAQIHEARPGWLVFRDGCPGGETPEQVGIRTDRVIARARAASGDVAMFAHGHVLRALAGRWIGLPASAGQHFLLDTGTRVCPRLLPRHTGRQGVERPSRRLGVR